MSCFFPQQVAGKEKSEQTKKLKRNWKK